jgi:hypothetical protein
MAPRDYIDRRPRKKARYENREAWFLHWFYGAGVRFNFGKFSVLGEWERYKLREVDINAVSAGFRVTL